MGAIAEALKRELATPEPDFAEGYAESFLNTWIAAQIKVLRLQRGMTQDALAAVLQTSQAVISRSENVNYSAWNIGTLKKLARAFEVRLKVSFEEYGTLPDEVERFSEAVLRKDKRTEDRNLLHAPMAQVARNPENTIHLVPMPKSHLGIANGNKNPGGDIAYDMAFPNGNNSYPGMPGCAYPVGSASRQGGDLRATG